MKELYSLGDIVNVHGNKMIVSCVQVDADYGQMCQVSYVFAPCPIKRDYPPRPTEEQLLEWGVRIVGDEPRLPKVGESFVSDSCEAWIKHSAYPASTPRWIVEPDPYAEAKRAFKDGELQYESFHGGWKDWFYPDINWNAFSPCALRRKPKEPQGKWVECDVREVEDCYLFTAPNKLSRLITDAPSVKGFGGYCYDGVCKGELEWTNVSDGLVIRKPTSVRFWVTP